jgi:luciferase family oxidoreductase group 1
VIAEQFGTLAALHPGRIDLGLGRAPGTDQNTVRALRRDPRAAESFPQNVVELQAYLSDTNAVPGVNATPGRGSHVPLYILGSSLFGAQLAAMLGLPFGFASHFAPQSLQEAVRIYRERFVPSEQLAEPHVIAGVNVIAAESEEARMGLERRRRSLVKVLFGRQDRALGDAEIEQVRQGPQGQHVDQMLTFTALGHPDQVRANLSDFRAYADADEILVAHHAESVEGRLRSLDLLGAAMALAPV